MKKNKSFFYGLKKFDFSKNKKRKRKFTWKKFWTLSLYSIVGFIFLIAIMFAWFAKDLPTPAKIANRKATESTKIYDRTGETLLYETGDQKRTVVKSDQITQYIKDATIATEDANFYRHHGFDSKGLLRAVWYKITHKTNRMTGASTITQQYVKNALLTSDRSITRKFKELILSIELEFMYSKDEILTMYLNEIPYGNSNAGAEAGARMYYGKTAKDLTLAQAATLAAIPQSPTYYSPYGTHTDKLIARRNYVLDRMVETGKISKEEAEAAKLEDTTTLNVALKPRKDTMLAPHFAMYIIENIAEQYGDEKIQKEGLKIITTLDLEKQKIAEEAVTANVAKFSQNNASNAALVSVDPRTGEIMAMVGSKDYFDTTIDGNVNVADSLRQPGSSFKPIVYSTLFKKPEYSPSKNIFDLQTDFGNGYIPKNYNGSFSGPVTIRHALANSLNIPAVKATSLAGIDNIIRTAEDMGITSLTDRDKYGLSFGLGVAEVKPIEMAGAFGVLANNGVRHDIKGILKITDSKGKTVYEYNKDRDTGKKVLDPQIAYEVTDILKDNNARTPMFGARSALSFGDRPIAAKTGTTSDNKDSWTVGYSPTLATAVWVGNNQPTPMKAGGVMLAAPVFHTFMEKSLANVPKDDFVRPEGIQEFTVEKFSNKIPVEGGSSQLIKDIFATWQLPKENDDVNIRVRVCKSMFKLAPDNLPEDMSEFKTYTNLRSERPDNPNWENPVRAWADSAGFSNLPPKDYCNVSEYESSINITVPSSGATVSGISDISASASSTYAIQSVEFFIDDISVGKVAASPYQVTYDFSTLPEGIHKVSALLTNEITTKKTEITINVQKTQQLTISNIQSSVSADTVTITWTTNVPASSQAAYKKTSETEYSMTELDDTMTTDHSATISAELGKRYYYRVLSVDASGNSVTSAEKTFDT